MTYLKKMKAELKALASEIRTERYSFRDRQRTFSTWCRENPMCHTYGSVEYKAMRTEENKVRWPGGDPGDFRHKHIAYCLLRGRTYEQIEPTVKKGNEPSWKVIDAIVAEGSAALLKERRAYEALRSHAS